MDVHRELRPRREIFVVVALLLLAPAAVVLSVSRDFPALHSILDTAAFLLSASLAFLLWDMGWRTAQPLARFNAVCFAVVALLELLHVITALDFSEAHRFAVLLRPGSFSPAIYLLPAGLVLALPLSRRDTSVPLFAAALLVAAAGLMTLFAVVPRYSEPGILGITRPTLIAAPLLWLPVIVAHWRNRGRDRMAEVFVVFAALSLCVPLLMLFSQSPADKVAVIAHLVRVAGEVFLLFSLMQMGTFDAAQRMRAERELSALNTVLESRVGERTRELEVANATLRQAITTREQAEHKTLKQLEQLRMLHQITQAVGERQDTASIFQVVVNSLEDQMPVDFACLCHYEQSTEALTMACVGARSTPLAMTLGLSKDAVVTVGENCMSSVMRGQLVHEPELLEIPFPFPQHMASGGLRTLVAAPLKVESRNGVFGLLLVARAQPHSFTSNDCEFLNQLSEHVALAVNQAQLHEALQRAYDELRDTQQAVMQQERLRTLGQMASGIAHDINNAISPATLYVDSILEHEPELSTRARGQLEVVQRAIGDVAHTVARMGEFYRQRDAQPMALQSLNVNEILTQIPDLTRARWSDMAQARGAAIAVRVEKSPDSPVIRGIDSEMREALINLVFNAADALPNGGTITLRSAVAIANRKTGARPVIVEVIDNGAGMDEATRARCMEPFFTTKAERGSGLGLAMVYGIARRHGADIEIDSELGKGTTVRLKFPASEIARTASPVETHSAPVPSLRILLVDDDPLLLKSLHDALDYEGHRVTCANGGQEGIDAFVASKQRGEPFPVVITDLGMPRVDGRQVADAVRKCDPATLILMLTGWGQRLVETDDPPQHVDKVLAKPPNMWQLREALARVKPR